MPERLFDISLTVNGVVREARVPARRLLSDCLRHDLGLTGTHVGCEHGVCGCCTVLLDGEPVRSCLTFAVTVAGQDVTTVEGLADGDTMSPVQRAFAECHALQCGFCTPGFLCTVTALLADNPAPTDEEVLAGISGNLCRCTGYQNIVKAVHRAAELSAEAALEPPPERPAGRAARAAGDTAAGDTAAQGGGAEGANAEGTAGQSTGTEGTGGEGTGAEAGGEEGDGA